MYKNNIIRVGRFFGNLGIIYDDLELKRSDINCGWLLCFVVWNVNIF